MKVSKKDLQKIIKEEMNSILSEFGMVPTGTQPAGPRAGMDPKGGGPRIKKKPLPKGEISRAAIGRSRKQAATGAISQPEAETWENVSVLWNNAATEHATLHAHPDVQRGLKILRRALVAASKK